MSDHVSRKLCPECKGPRKATSPRPTHLLHLALSLLTIGFWVPVWLWVSLSRDWRCWVCGAVAQSDSSEILTVLAVLFFTAFWWFGLVLTVIPWLLLQAHLASMGLR